MSTARTGRFSDANKTETVNLEKLIFLEEEGATYTLDELVAILSSDPTYIAYIQNFMKICERSKDSKSANESTAITKNILQTLEELAYAKNVKNLIFKDSEDPQAIWNASDIACFLVGSDESYKNFIRSKYSPY